MIVAVWPFTNTTVRGSIPKSTETGAFPDAEIILNDLRPLLKESDRIYAIGPSHAQLVYYGEKMGIDRLQFPNPGVEAPTDESLLICPNEYRNSIEEYLKTLFSSLSQGEVKLFKTYSNSRVFRIKHAH